MKKLPSLEEFSKLVTFRAQHVVPGFTLHPEVLDELIFGDSEHRAAYYAFNGDDDRFHVFGIVESAKPSDLGRKLENREVDVPACLFRATFPEGVLATCYYVFCGLGGLPEPEHYITTRSGRSIISIKGFSREVKPFEAPPCHDPVQYGGFFERIGGGDLKNEDVVNIVFGEHPQGVVLCYPDEDKPSHRVLCLFAEEAAKNWLDENGTESITLPAVIKWRAVDESTAECARKAVLTHHLTVMVPFQNAPSVSCYSFGRLRLTWAIEERPPSPPKKARRPQPPPQPRRPPPAPNPSSCRPETAEPPINLDALLKALSRAREKVEFNRPLLVPERLIEDDPGDGDSTRDYVSIFNILAAQLQVAGECLESAQTLKVTMNKVVREIRPQRRIFPALGPTSDGVGGAAQLSPPDVLAPGSQLQPLSLPAGLMVTMENIADMTTIEQGLHQFMTLASPLFFIDLNTDESPRTIKRLLVFDTEAACIAAISSKTLRSMTLYQISSDELEDHLKSHRSRMRRWKGSETDSAAKPPQEGAPPVPFAGRSMEPPGPLTASGSTHLIPHQAAISADIPSYDILKSLVEPLEDLSDLHSPSLGTALGSHGLKDIGNINLFGLLQEVDDYINTVELVRKNFATALSPFLELLERSLEE